MYALTLGLAFAAVALLALTPFAFWPAYLSRLGTADAYTHVHAVLGMCWLFLLAVQPLFIRASMRTAHRHLGRIGVLIGAGFAMSGLLIAHRSVARMSLDQFAREGHLVYLPLAMAAIFAAALVLAVLWRRTAAAHGRFMAATVLPLLDPLFARLLYFYAPPLPMEALYQVPAFGLSIAVVVIMFVSLPAASPARRSFQCFGAGVTALLLGFFAVPSTATWQAFAAWFRALPIT